MRPQRKSFVAENATKGGRLKHARKAVGLSQAQVAQAIGVTQASISRYESNQDAPGGTVLQGLLKLLEINYSWLESGQGPMHISTKGLTKEALDIAHRLDALSAEERKFYVDFLMRGLPPAGLPPKK
jgi:transcriptional regulator with XRE-family HTH domain